MTKKNYVAFAHMISEMPDTISKDDLISQMSEILKVDNSKFGAAIFRKVATKRV